LNYSIQEKDYLAVVRGAPSRASCWRSHAREGAPRTRNNIFLNAIEDRKGIEKVVTHQSLKTTTGTL
jgi:hypothetical protein